jgi:hypothetical protein
MKKRFQLVMLFLCALSTPILADVVLTVNPTPQSVLLGSQVSFNINIAGLGNGTALGTYDINLGFDPASLSYSATTFGNQLDLFGLGDIQTVTPGSSSVDIYELSLESVSDLNTLQASSFTLATLTFDTLAAGVNSALNLSIIALGDASGNAITASLQNATVSINPSAVPVPATVWLFGSALGVIGFLCKRRIA